MSNRDRENTHPNWGEMRNFQMFSQGRLDLAQEVKKHPDLIALLQKHPQNEFEILLAEIAAYCEVVLDGDYTPAQLDKLCAILYRKLQYKRTGIIFANMDSIPKNEDN